MNAPQGPAEPANGTAILAIPDFEKLAADPEIAPLLGFEPVVRKIKRPDGWTPELQRELIARIASTGTLQSAVWQMGKHATGAEALYKTPGAVTFRMSWDAAIIIGRRRNHLDSNPPFAGPVPGINRRGSARDLPPEPSPEPTMSDDQKWSLVESIAAKFLRKVEAEREARTQGRIVAADFYLRQITFLEVMMDLTACRLGFDPHEVLGDLRRGGHGVMDIVSTPFAELLDRARCVFWETQGDPPRPDHPDPRFVVEHGDGPWGPRGAEGYSTAVEVEAAGPLTHPAEGFSKEQWAEMHPDDQRAARQTQWQREAERQVEWEAKARRDYDERRASDASA